MTLYQSQRGAMRMALAGELIITRSLKPYCEERYLQLLKLLRAADVAFGNSECMFHNYEGSPAPDNAGTYQATVWKIGVQGRPLPSRYEP